MSERGPKAVVVDCYPALLPTGEILENTEQLLNSDSNTDNHVVYIITTTTHCDVIDSHIHKTPAISCHQVVTSSSKIGAFYKTKTDFDLKDIKDILIICCEENMKYWTNVCDILLTKGHQWEIQTFLETTTTTTTAKSDTRHKDDDVDDSNKPKNHDDNWGDSEKPKREDADDSDKSKRDDDHDFDKPQNDDDDNDNYDSKKPKGNNLNDLKTTISNYLQSIPSDGQINILYSPMLDKNQFVHGFTTRTGGICTVSTMKSLDLFYFGRKKDPPIVVDENKRRVAETVGVSNETFYISKCNHGIEVWVVDEEEPKNYDAIVTNKRGVTIAGPGGDCLVILLADPVRMVCGVAHIGFIGTTKAAIVEPLRIMVNVFNCDPKDILVVMGPSIRPCCAILKSDDETVTAFKDISPSCVIADEEDNYRVDIFKANSCILVKEGIRPENIDDTSVGICTCCNPETFFSYARDGDPFGCQIGFIGIL